MIVRRAWIALAIGALATIGCANPFGTHYEYEEQLYLSVDGRATVVIDSSLVALVALRGLAIDPALDAPNDRDSIRRVFERANCRVDSVSRLWTRSGRRFAQVQLAIDDIRQPQACGPLAWSAYSLKPIDPDGLEYKQNVSGPSPPQTPVNAAVWDGSELVAFKLHAPSRIRYQNVKLLDGTNGTTERGNILTWEQRLTDRLAGKPVDIDVRMDSTSILHTTLWLFGGAFLGAVLTLMAIIWWVIKRGGKRGVVVTG